MNYLGLRGKSGGITGYSVIKSRADSNQQVSSLHGRNCRDGAMHARHAHVERMRFWEGPQGHERSHDRDSGKFRKLAQLLGRLGLDDTAAGIDDRLFCLCNELNRLRDLAMVRLGCRFISRQIKRSREGIFQFTVLHVLRDIHQDRPRTARRRQMECGCNGSWNLARFRHDVVVLGNRHRHAADIGLLEGIGSQEVAAHLAGDGDDGNGVQVGFGKRCHQVGRTRPGGGNAYAYLAGSLGVAFGGVAGTLFMAGEHMAQLGRGVQGIV